MEVRKVTALKPGEIRFHDCVRPSLDPGQYTVEVTQKARQLTERDITGALNFSVAGPRFSLGSDDLNKAYPPPGHMGDFAGSLPHIVLNRRTLAWERNLTKHAPPNSPWMALLLLSAADFADETQVEDRKVPEVKQRTFSELRAAGGNILPPDFKAEAYEENDICLTVDLRLDLFRKVAPALNELPYTAHVREVNPADKESREFLGDGWYSLVVGNRFPQPQRAGDASAIENTVFLVSLEGVTQYLEGAGSLPAGSEGKKIRLIVLANWSFFCNDAVTFKQAVLDVKGPNSDRIVPFGLSVEGVENFTVKEAFQRGFVALNHSTRLGEKTVSWYRGPLSPVKVIKTIPGFHPIADALLGYDIRTGLMDTTYAAAWQLGRLLGLQDRVFSRDLNRWRDQQVARRAQAEEIGALSSLLGGANAPAANSVAEVLSHNLLAAIERRKKKFVEDEPALSTSSAAMVGGSRSGYKPDPPPASVCQWLASLILLYRVPFCYLVPEERLLPPNSMRFFRLDPDWIASLLEGACSVGRNSTSSQPEDYLLRSHFLDYTLRQVPLVRRRPDEPERDSTQGAAQRWSLEGFLLRSPLVEGWQGLEMRAWRTKEMSEENPLNPLRIDRLSPDVLLCIFDGPVEMVEIRQPQEGMHFGATLDAVRGTYQKTCLRAIHENGRKPGEQITLKEPMGVALRSAQSVARVVNILELVSDLGKRLAPEVIRSAALALQMTESPGRFRIEIENSSTLS